MANRDFIGNFNGNDKLSKSTGSGFGNFLRHIGNVLFGKGDGTQTGFFQTGLGKTIAGLINPILGVGVNLLGTSVANKTINAHLTGKEQEQNAFNAEQAQLNRDFQEEMSNTSYQRAVTDMQNAGVNPALAMSNGGASTPTGSNAQGSASVINPMTAMVEAMKSFAELKLMKDQGDALQKNANAAVTTADAAAKNAETNAKNAETQARSVDVQDFRAGIEKVLADQNVKESNERIDKMAVEADHTRKVLSQLDDYLEIAKKQNDNDAIKAIAALRSAAAAMQDANTRAGLAPYQANELISKAYLNGATGLLQGIMAGEHYEVYKRLPERLQLEIDNLKEDIRLTHRKGNTESATTIRNYIGVASDVISSVTNTLDKFGSASSLTGVDFADGMKIFGMFK